MPKAIDVTVHPTQFPESVQNELLEGLRSRRIAPKFHYQSYKQAQLWMALHRACSPAWLDPDATAIYERSFAAAAGMVSKEPVHLIGLGSGSGYKEARLLRKLAERTQKISYTPCDVSLPLLLTSVREAENIPDVRGKPLLCDLARADDLSAAFYKFDEQHRRIVTFFGMIPNFEPDQALPKLAALTRPDDLLLLSANLAPGSDYRKGVERVLPGYDNEHTRAWLMAFLEDFGVERNDGALDFSIEEVSGLLRIVADFRFLRERTIIVHEEKFVFNAGDVVRLFFSYRHTPDTLRQLLANYHLCIVEQWITNSEEEGVFICRKQAG